MDKDVLNGLIDGCIKNDRISQKTIYNLFSSKLFSICLRYAKDKSEAEDILQDGFISILGHMNQYNKDKSFDGWLRKIMVNTAIDNYHRNLKYYNQEDIAEIHEIDINNIDIKESDFTFDELSLVLKTLPTGFKTVFNMYAIDGYKHKEIANILGISESTSKSQYHRSKLLLQSKLHELSKEK